MTGFHSTKTKAAKALAGVAIIVALPFLVIAKLLVLPFEKPVDLSADEVAKYLRDFRDGTGESRDWDEFTSVSIADPELEEMRRRAANLDFSLSGDATAQLDGLIAEVQALMGRNEVRQ